MDYVTDYEEIIKDRTEKLDDVGEDLEYNLYTLCKLAQKNGIDVTFTRRKTGVCVITPECEFLGGALHANTPSDIARVALATLAYIQRMEDTKHVETVS